MRLLPAAAELSPLPPQSLHEKPCRLCGIIKPLSEFHLLRKAKDGRQPACKDCACARARKWARDNRDHTLAAHRAYYQKNKASMLEQGARWAREHPEKMLEYSRKCWAKHREKRNATKKAYRAANKAKCREYYLSYHAERPELKNFWDAERRAQEKRAMPPWANRRRVAEFYKAAKLKTQETGVIWHVDHIIPLQHELVCGLHVEANLQLLPASDNMSKSNRFQI